ncbi:hypothetical protein ACIBCT_38905 [Streptosporangium sp. NPDC050855]|uniref:hypothetical protein n=1 Tax=Streptosporangium sp. NPDC050855 TaxID=3366194 RepID=UPI0037ACFCA3
MNDRDVADLLDDLTLTEAYIMLAHLAWSVPQRFAAAADKVTEFRRSEAALTERATTAEQLQTSKPQGGN